MSCATDVIGEGARAVSKGAGQDLALARREVAHLRFLRRVLLRALVGPVASVALPSSEADPPDAASAPPDST